MSIKSTIAAVAASPFLFAGAAFAGPYVNLEANGSYPDGDYTEGALEAQIGYEGATEGGLGWYASVGPTVGHTEAADEFGDVEIAGYFGASKSITESTSLYGELYGQTADFYAQVGPSFVAVDGTDGSEGEISGKVGVKFTF